MLASTARIEFTAAKENKLLTKIDITAARKSVFSELHKITTSDCLVKSDSLSKKFDTPKNDPFAYAGLFLGLAGLLMLLFFPFSSIPASIIAIICSAIALSRIRKNPEKYKGKKAAIAGLVLGIVGFAVPATLIVLFLFGGI